MPFTYTHGKGSFIPERITKNKLYLWRSRPLLLKTNKVLTSAMISTFFGRHLGNVACMHIYLYIKCMFNVRSHDHLIKLEVLYMHNVATRGNHRVEQHVGHVYRHLICILNMSVSFSCYRIAIIIKV